MKLGIVLSTARDLAIATATAVAARRARAEVTLFAMDAGVTALAAEPAAVADLLAADCTVVACATSADAAQLALPAGVQLGSQDDHAALIATADRVLALT
jgi:hypothetical protein